MKIEELLYVDDQFVGPEHQMRLYIKPGISRKQIQKTLCTPHSSITAIKNAGFVLQYPSYHDKKWWAQVASIESGSRWRLFKVSMDAISQICTMKPKE